MKPKDKKRTTTLRRRSTLRPSRWPVLSQPARAGAAAAAQLDDESDCKTIFGRVRRLYLNLQAEEQATGKPALKLAADHANSHLRVIQWSPQLVRPARPAYDESAPR